VTLLVKQLGLDATGILSLSRLVVNLTGLSLASKECKKSVLWILTTFAHGDPDGDHASLCAPQHTRSAATVGYTVKF
jgi:hypothetical protein